MTKMERQADDALDEQLGQHKNTIYSALGALAVLRDLNASNKRKLPTGTATAFLSTRWIQDRGVRFAAGLAETELEELQEAHSVIFPPDLAAFLQRVVPVGDRFPDWRGRSQDLQSRFEEPLQGILFDVEHNDFWAPSWGSRPTELRQALAKTKAVVNAAPKLIPVYSHRYIPSEPSLSGNPVLSVVQTDIIRYGDGLLSYFHAEFGVPLPVPPSVPSPRRIRFWDELLELNGEPAGGGT